MPNYNCGLIKSSVTSSIKRRSNLHTVQFPTGPTAKGPRLLRVSDGGRLHCDKKNGVRLVSHCTVTVRSSPWRNSSCPYFSKPSVSRAPPETTNVSSFFKSPFFWWNRCTCDASRVRPNNHQSRRGFTRQPESPNVHISGSRRFKNTTKFPREDTQRDTERAKWEREREKKARNFGHPTFAGLTLRGPTLRGPMFLGLGAHLSGLHPSEVLKGVCSSMLFFYLVVLLFLKKKKAKRLKHNFGQSRHQLFPSPDSSTGLSVMAHTFCTLLLSTVQPSLLLTFLPVLERWSHLVGKKRSNLRKPCLPSQLILLEPTLSSFVVSRQLSREGNSKICFSFSPDVDP